MTEKTERLVIRCSEETKAAYQMFAAAYDDSEMAIQALLEGYASEPEAVRSVVTFEIDFDRRSQT